MMQSVCTWQIVHRCGSQILEGVLQCLYGYSCFGHSDHRAVWAFFCIRKVLSDIVTDFVIAGQNLCLLEVRETVASLDMSLQSAILNI